MTASIFNASHIANPKSFTGSQDEGKSSWHEEKPSSSYVHFRKMVVQIFFTRV